MNIPSHAELKGPQIEWQRVPGLILLVSDVETRVTQSFIFTEHVSLGWGWRAAQTSFRNSRENAGGDTGV